MNIETQLLIDTIGSRWINFHNFYHAYRAIQKIKEPHDLLSAASPARLRRGLRLTVGQFQGVLIGIALRKRPYDLATRRYL